MAIGIGTLGDGFVDAGKAGGGGVTTLLSTSLIRAATSPTFATKVPTSSANGGCGDEPARKQVGPVSVYADANAGAAWLACMDRNAAAAQAAALKAIDAAPDCGPEPAFNTASSGAKIYVNGPLGAYWAACKARRSSSPQTTSPPIVPGAAILVASSLAPAPSSGVTIQPSQIIPSGDSGAGPTVVAAAAAPKPAAVRATFGASFNAPDWAWIGGGLAVAAGIAWALRKKGVF